MIHGVMRPQDIGADDEIGRAVVKLADLRVNEVKDIWADVKPLMEHEGVRASGLGSWLGLRVRIRPCLCGLPCSRAGHTADRKGGSIDQIRRPIQHRWKDLHSSRVEVMSLGAANMFWPTLRSQPICQARHVGDGSFSLLSLASRGLETTASLAL